MAPRKTSKTSSTSLGRKGAKKSSSTKAAKKAASKTRADSTKAAARVEALRGRAVRGEEWDPAQPEAMAPSLPELNEPRPYSTRYPIPAEQFQALKDRAPRAKILKVTAEQARDTNEGGEELSARAMAPPILAPGAAPVAAPTGAANFAGLATTWLPPDCTMAVGPEHVLLSVNSSVAIYDKASGTPLLQRTLTQWFSNVVQGMTIFDPKALFDQHEGRWVLLAVGVQNSPRRSVFLLSVSNTTDPLQPWRNYRLDATRDGTTATNNWADYPALGVDNQALYLTANMFAFGGGFQYSKIRVVPKAGPYSGGSARFFDFVRMRNPDNSTAFTIQPCHTFGAPQVEYLVNTRFPSGNSLTLWSITNAATTPTLTRQQVPVSPYSLPPNADQKGGATPLNTGDVRVLHAVFRGDSIWTAFTTAHNWGESVNRASIEWCQVRAAIPSIVQQGVYGAANFHYFYPAGCPDNNGNMVMVFSRSGPSEFGSILFTGRRSTDALGTLQSSVMLNAGIAPYVRLDGGGRNRWGDYAGVAADPANPRLIWFYNEYASALNTWGTWVGSAFF
jgi:hypothetical protein